MIHSLKLFVNIVLSHSTPKSTHSQYFNLIIYNIIMSVYCSPKGICKGNTFIL